MNTNLDNRYQTAQLTRGQRLADSLAATIGSWPFIIIQSVGVIAWVVLNLTAYIEGWDPYPFILLNLLFSVQAAYAGPIIMMSQNRQSERDRQHAAFDLKTDLQSKEEIEGLRTALTRLETQKIDQILELLRDKQAEDSEVK